MIDIHTHLYFSDYDDDRQATLDRAFASGLEKMISVSTSPEDHERALAIGMMDERVFVSIGLHPHTFDDHLGDTAWMKRSLRTMQRLIVENPKKIVAIGECGLDYFSREVESASDERRAWQREGFEAQIALAKENHLPVIVHCRDAYDDMLDVLLQYRDTAFVLHCYMADTEITRRFLELPRVSFSFTGYVTYPVRVERRGTQSDIRETVKLVPLDRILTETDCPFLAPIPYRGKRNEPSYVSEVVKAIAEAKNCSSESVEGAVRENVCAVFGI